MPFDIAPTRRSRRLGQRRRARAAPRRSAAPPSEPASRWCSSSSSSRAAPVREAEQLGEVADRPVRRRRAGRRAADLGAARRSAARARTRSSPASTCPRRSARAGRRARPRRPRGRRRRERGRSRRPSRGRRRRARRAPPTIVPDEGRAHRLARRRRSSRSRATPSAGRARSSAACSPARPAAPTSRTSTSSASSPPCSATSRRARWSRSAPASTHVRRGDRVAIHHHSPCGECRRCRRGHETLCEQFRSTRLDPGGFAEYVRVQAELVDELLPLDGLDPVLATFTEPLALRAARPGRAGPAPATPARGRRRRSGLLHIAAAHAGGVEAVWVREPDPDRLARAERWGATAHGNEPVDVAIVCTPRARGDRRRGRGARPRRRAVRLRAAAARQPAGDRRQRGVHARARRHRELVGRPGRHARARSACSPARRCARSS